LFEVLDEEVRQDSLWKVIPWMGEASNKRVVVCSHPGFWKCNQERTEKAEGAVLEKRWWQRETTGLPVI